MDKLAALAKDPRAQSVALASIAAALVMAVTAPSADDPAREDKLAAVGDALKAGTAETKPALADKLDTATLHTEIRKLRDADPQLVDMGAGLVEPGATYVTGANVAKGAHLVAVEDCPGHVEMEGLVCVLDPGAWAITAAECRDGASDATTWCEVTARNASKVAQRLLVVVRIEGGTP